MPDVYVAAGSNIEPHQKLRQALDALRQQYGEIQTSRAYQNEAVGFSGPDFVNLVVRFTTENSPAAVLEILHSIEESCGRSRNAPKWAARAMDLDVLLYGDLVAEQPGLIVPRPDLVRRPYMLGPMAELAPSLQHPTLHKTMLELWRELPTEHALVPVDL